MNHSVRVGVPSMSIVCLPVTVTTTIENAIVTAKAASAGTDLNQTRRTRVPGRSTAGRPRWRNQRSAAVRCADVGLIVGNLITRSCSAPAFRAAS